MTGVEPAIMSPYKGAAIPLGDTSVVLEGLEPPRLATARFKWAKATITSQDRIQYVSTSSQVRTRTSHALLGGRFLRRLRLPFHHKDRGALTVSQGRG